MEKTMVLWKKKCGTMEKNYGIVDKTMVLQKTLSYNNTIPKTMEL